MRRDRRVRVGAGRGRRRRPRAGERETGPADPARPGAGGGARPDAPNAGGAGGGAAGPDVEAMVALSREAGPFVLSEPELRAGLAEAEASGRLACALCGAPLEAAQATFVRRPLAHRWATLPVHPECARAVGAPPAPAPAPVPAPARPSPPRPAGWPAARLGRLAARRPLAALALTYPDAGAAAAALADLGVRDVPPAGDFDPECGPMVRAVHGLFPDLPVLPLPGLEVSIRPAGHATAEVAIVLPGARLRVRAAAEGLAAFEASAAAGCLILLEAAAAGDGPAEPVAALLRAPG